MADVFFLENRLKVNQNNIDFKKTKPKEQHEEKARRESAISCDNESRPDSIRRGRITRCQTLRFKLLRLDPIN